MRATRARRLALHACAAMLVTILATPTLGAVSDASAHATSKPTPWSVSTRVDEGPTVSGRFVVATTSASGALKDVALSSSDGGIAWSEPTTLSLIPPTEEAPPAVVDGVALVMTPSTGYFKGFGAGLEGVTVDDGVPAWNEKGSFAVLSAPTRCAGPSGVNDFCLVVNEKSGGTPLLVAIDARSGKLVAEYTGVDEQLVGGLYETTKAPLSLTLFTLPKGFAWTDSIAKLFGSTAYSPQYGSEVATVGDVTIVSLGYAPVKNVQNLSNEFTVGLSSKTGAVLWRDRGGLDCSGVMTVSGPYLCDESGTLTVDPGKSSSLSHAAVTIEGLDPSTGHLTWKFRVGDVEDFLGGSGVAIDSAVEVVVPDSHGTPVLLNLATGVSRGVPSTAQLWCPREEAFVDETVAATPLLRIGSAGFTSCNADRTAASASSNSAPPSAVLANAHLIWVTTSGASAIPARSD